MYDARLVRAAQEGDEAAFAALYDRCVEAVHDLCWWLTGDIDEAARLTSEAFSLAAEHLGELTEPSQLRPWLLAIARDRAMTDAAEGVLRSGWGVAPPSAGNAPLGAVALRDWAAEATAVMALEDQAALALQLRYELDDDQLAAVIECPPPELATVIDEVDREAESVLSALVLARQGRNDCAELASVLSGWDGGPTAEVADRADAHAAGCATCRKRRKVVSGLELVAEAPLVPVPGGLRGRVLEEAAPALAGLAAAAPRAPASAVTEVLPAAVAAAPVAAEARRTAAADATWAATPVTAATAATAGAVGAATVVPGGPGRPADPPRRTTPVAALVGIAAGAAVLIGAVILALHHPGAKSSSNIRLTSPTTTAGPANSAIAPQSLVPLATTTSTSVPPGSVLALSSGRADLGTTATSAEVILSDAGGTPAAWRASWSASYLSVSPASARLSAGQTMPITFTVNRRKAPAGAFDARVVFAGSDAGSQAATIDVVGDNSPTTSTSTSTTVVRAVTIDSVSASPSTVYTTPCALRPTSSTVTATITDSTGGTPTVMLSYTMPDGSAGTVNMTAGSSGEWSATLPPTTTPGTISYQVSASDGGPTVTSAGHTVTVVSCSAP